MFLVKFTAVLVFRYVYQIPEHENGIKSLYFTPVENNILVKKICRSQLQAATMMIVPVVEDDDFD